MPLRRKYRRVASSALADSRDLKSLGFERAAHPSSLVSLDFDGPSFDRATASASRPYLFRHFLDHRSRQVRRKIVYHDHRLASAVRGFAP